MESYMWNRPSIMAVFPLAISTLENIFMKVLIPIRCLQKNHARLSSPPLTLIRKYKLLLQQTIHAKCWNEQE